MSGKTLSRSQVGAPVEETGGKRVSENMRCHPPVDSRCRGGLADGVLKRAVERVMAADDAGGLDRDWPHEQETATAIPNVRLRARLASMAQHEQSMR